MRRLTLSMIAVLGLTLGCEDGPVGVDQTPVDEEASTALDFTPILDLLDDPLVHELLGGFSDKKTAQMARSLVRSLSAPHASIQLPEVQTALDQLQEQLMPREEDYDDELVRAVLALIVDDAEAVLASLLSK